MKCKRMMYFQFVVFFSLVGDIFSNVNMEYTVPFMNRNGRVAKVINVLHVTCRRVMVIVFNATFNNISVIS
jgi:hypothetical protein